MTSAELGRIQKDDWVVVVDAADRAHLRKVTAAGPSWITVGRGTRYHRLDGRIESGRGTARIIEHRPSQLPSKEQP